MILPTGVSGVAQNEMTRKIFGSGVREGLSEEDFKSLVVQHLCFAWSGTSITPLFLRELGRQFGIRNIGPLTFTKRFYKNQNTKISRMMSLLQDSHSIPLPTSCTHSKDPGCIASFVQELDLHRSLTSFWAEARCS